MRCVAAAVVVLLTSVAQGVEELPRVSGTIDGKPVKFAEKGLADGVKAAVDLLESCRAESFYQADEFKNALRGDHVRLVLVRPIPARVTGEKIEFSELVFRLPMGTGVFWVRTGDNWRRYSKFEFPKEAPFAAWLRQARPVD